MSERLQSDPLFDPLGAATEASAPAPKPAVPEGKQSVSALRSTLKLNPAMFMPGARPAPKPQPVVEDEPKPDVSPATATSTAGATGGGDSGVPGPVLGQVTVGRARGPQRKPPTKRDVVRREPVAW